jgi:hypothetical protein
MGRRALSKMGECDVDEKVRSGHDHARPGRVWRAGSGSRVCESVGAPVSESVGAPVCESVCAPVCAPGLPVGLAGGRVVAA